MMQQYMKELEQEPFDPEEFVERLAWRTVDSNREEGNSTFDPVLMHETFSQAITDFFRIWRAESREEMTREEISMNYANLELLFSSDLQILLERQQKKCEKLEQACKEEETSHWQDISKLQERNKSTVSLFQELDERINFVATKVIHLGDQLESVNTPRSRAVQAQKLMNHFAEFLTPGPVMAEFSQVGNLYHVHEKIDEAADVIQKLHMIAQELPSGKFEDAKRKIAVKYDEIERALIEEFVEAHRKYDVNRMREIASILSHFKGYTQCVDAFIEHSQSNTFGGKDVFSDVIPMCEKNFTLMSEVFNNPEQVMGKFVLNIYHFKLQKYIVGKLSDKSDTDRYLKNFMDLFSRTVQLSKELSKFKMGTDDTYLNTLTRNIFQKYFDSYISIETKSLKDKCTTVLNKYYESKGHQKRPLQVSGFQDLRRDLQAVIGTRANINIAQIEDYGGETFLSEEVAIALLQEAKVAFQRCQVLSQSSQLVDNAVRLIDVLLCQLLTEHVEYAIELGLQAVPLPEAKTQRPHVYFFNIAAQANAIVHLVEKQFIDSLLPIVISTPKYHECLQMKKRILDPIEVKLDTGLDRSVNAIIGWVKIFLQAEQKKTDFRPETDVDTLSSPACLAVVQYMNGAVVHLRDSLDGKNLEHVMCELGVRFHRVIYDHLLQFTYNSAGAMCVICDVNEYRKCVKELRSPLVTTLFDTLHGLCNLLLVKPENLKQVCTGGTLAGLDRSILLNFIQLRSDYKTQKLASSLKGLAT